MRHSLLAADDSKAFILYFAIVALSAALVLIPGSPLGPDCRTTLAGCAPQRHVFLLRV